MRAQAPTCQFAALDRFVASEPLLEALAAAARRLWEQAGGCRATAKSFWVAIDEEPWAAQGLETKFNVEQENQIRNQFQF